MSVKEAIEGKAHFKLFWSGGCSLTGKLKGRKVNRIKIKLENIAEISAKIDKSALSAKVQQLQMKMRENTDNTFADSAMKRTVSSFNCPLGAAKTMEMKAQLIQLFENGSRARYIHPIDHRKPEFEDGKTYGIYLVLEKGNDIKGIFKECDAETDSNDDDVHFRDLLVYFCEQVDKYSEELCEDPSKRANDDFAQLLLGYTDQDITRLLDEAKDPASLTDGGQVLEPYRQPFIELLNTIKEKFSNMKTAEPVLNAYVECGFEQALKMAETIKELDAHYFALLCLANVCIEKRQFGNAFVALQKVPKSTEGKDGVMSYYKEQAEKSNAQMHKQRDVSSTDFDLYLDNFSEEEVDGSDGQPSDLETIKPTLSDDLKSDKKVKSQSRPFKARRPSIFGSSPKTQRSKRRCIVS